MSSVRRSSSSTCTVSNVAGGRELRGGHRLRELADDAPAVLVGDGPQERLTWQGVGAGGGVAAVLAAPLAFGLRLHERTATNGKD